MPKQTPPDSESFESASVVEHAKRFFESRTEARQHDWGRYVKPTPEFIGSSWTLETEPISVPEVEHLRDIMQHIDKAYEAARNHDKWVDPMDDGSLLQGEMGRRMANLSTDEKELMFIYARVLSERMRPGRHAKRTEVGERALEAVADQDR